MRVGVQVSAVTVALLTVFRLLPHHGSMNESAFTVLLVVAVVGAVTVAVLPWRRLFATGYGMWAFYAWSLSDIGLVTVAITVTGGADSELFVLYALTSVFFAASYPPRGQLVLLGLTLAAYVAALFLSGSAPSGAVLLVRLATISLVTYLTTFLAQELMRWMLGQAQQAKANADLTQQAVRREARFRSLVQNASDVVCVVGEDGSLHYAAPAIERLLGYSADVLVGQNAFSAIHREDLQPVSDWFAALSELGQPPLEVDLRIRHADGTWLWVKAIFTNLVGEPSVSGVVVNFRDITERRAFEEQLRYQAFHDSLTGLPNRAQFLQKATAALSRCAREGGRLAVALLDLDGFKSVNDTLGHELGDELLVAVADRLRSALRPGDVLARLGGDEFTVLFTGVHNDAEPLALAESVLAALARPLDFGAHRSTQTASVGIAVAASGNVGANDMLRRADLAMYAAKARGKAQCALFDLAMSQRAEERLQLEEDLRAAVGRNELFLEYQPLVGLGEQRLSGTEALVRWRHPARGTVPPIEFVHIAEETGAILAIGRWVLNEACRQAALWLGQVQIEPGFRMSVNVSPRQFQQPDFVAEVQAALATAGLPGEMLQLEITEGLLVADNDEVIPKLSALRALGVAIAIDDFGTGYSSLSYLRHYPVDVLKLDKSFIDDMESQSDAAALVQSMLSLARSLGLKTVAEGIENSAQAAQLRAMSCEAGQGFYFARPAPPSEIVALLQRRSANAA